MKTEPSTVEQIRAFNRYYTKLLGLLDHHLLNSEYSLVEARILYEIHAHRSISASQIMLEIDIDKGYLSKVLKQFGQKGLIAKQPSPADARVTLLSLTAKGQTLFATLNSASNQQVETLIHKLGKTEQQQLVGHMQAIGKLLGS